MGGVELVNQICVWIRDNLASVCEMRIALSPESLFLGNLKMPSSTKWTSDFSPENREETPPLVKKPMLRISWGHMFMVDAHYLQIFEILNRCLHCIQCWSCTKLTFGFHDFEYYGKCFAVIEARRRRQNIFDVNVPVMCVWTWMLTS